MAGNKQAGRKSTGLNRKNIFLWLILAVVLAAAGFAAAEPTARAVYRQLYPREYKEYIEHYSREYGVERDLVYAVARIESNFDPKAVSSADARGVMQMTKDAFEWVNYRMGGEGNASYEQIFDPEVAIQYGTYMLHLLLEEMQDEKLAICAYHAGMGNVSSWLSKEEYSKDGKTLDKIPYSDTEWYYNKVSEAKQIYRRLYS